MDPAPSRSPDGAAPLACVVLAHTDPVHVRRLVAALDPFPVFLHCDARTPGDVYDRMTASLPDRVTLLPRRSTPWGGWGAVEAELDGYRAALAATDATHVALLSGSDYPLMASAAIAGTLAGLPGRSIAWSRPMPVPEWGLGGGLGRLRYRFAPWRKRTLVLPLPRRLPRGVVPAGGSQSKVLARSHAAAVLRVLDGRPDLVRRWRRTWIPDETFVYSVLHTPALVPGWERERIRAGAWVIHWAERGPAKSPAWLTVDDLDMLRRVCADPPDGAAKFFARKFGTAVDTAVLDEIDASFRGARTPAPE
ncbi:beta-1,6-N-acetylglucosaminyltransferase [Blastococcus tunisiensis]|uniref:Peptide O-xylosyltransferase n=1 Tax=Blastococcus tunisiensis TaxID=1798228 RepID=A0A1I2JB65_9ACTN|nr:beta-1,6-N-acetylglucosaminyltransferase [Blastococcus sp. DSM 46838]SFF51230.1 Core-2/I-Branching enzyme [Blastococcus sp. DSM 46838]